MYASQWHFHCFETMNIVELFDFFEKSTVESKLLSNVVQTSLFALRKLVQQQFIGEVAIVQNFPVSSSFSECRLSKTIKIGLLFTTLFKK